MPIAQRPALLALDLDGTALASGNSVSARVVAAVRAAAAAGVPATIVTGRMFSGARPHARSCGIAGPIVCYQGAVIADVDSGVFSRETPLAHEVAVRIYTAAKARGLHVQFYRDDEVLRRARQSLRGTLRADLGRAAHGRPVAAGGVPRPG